MTRATPTTAAAAAIHPFRLEVPQAQLNDLRERLARTRWPDDAAGGTWTYGIPLDRLQALTDYWRTGCDWRACEAELNRFAQFTTLFGGASVHFLHVRSPERHALPLIMTHGWPGSVVEFLDVIGPLTDPHAHGGDPADAFHLVLPHIPGFGLSGRTCAPFSARCANHPAKLESASRSTSNVFSTGESQKKNDFFGKSSGSAGRPRRATVRASLSARSVGVPCGSMPLVGY
ncbi:epoxide hydrolase family protein [Frankia sp. QA3]|uniref:epoxide hydrolase family protein n=1 Tax=Frankia sp. QA3 TaxID=710111 RepID=UPI000269CCCE|nr:epoxide hydrolase N-terminal domain-containing protein [Frankia sp. QA3]EIV96492.1 epoxide hydrolase family protein [Frankia sp. QA3]